MRHLQVPDRWRWSVGAARVALTGGGRPTARSHGAKDLVDWSREHVRLPVEAAHTHTNVLGVDALKRHPPAAPRRPGLLLLRNLRDLP
ncbi:hypothetical protein [Streptomyces umbrinus]|uniref:hypothetical protein n=1 Tax=Streptomyces umbrinus TaxID=67370 RepID=UPI00341678BB